MEIIFNEKKIVVFGELTAVPIFYDYVFKSLPTYQY